jgi:hypothetical protein
LSLYLENAGSRAWMELIVMPLFRVTFAKEWIEYGRAEIEAETKEDAEEIAKEMIETDDDSIDWDGSNMDPQAHRVESIE